MKKFLADYAMLLLISGAIVLLDQLSKNWVRSTLPMGEVFMPGFWLSQYARIIHWNNTGAAFGMFKNLSGVFTVLAFIVSGAILYYFPRIPRDQWLIRLALCLQLGGAVGNLVDRLTVGHVTDFISVFNFAVFNVADAAISCGVVLLIIGLWLQEKKEAHKPATASSNGSIPSAETPASADVEASSETDQNDGLSPTLTESPESE